MRRVRRVTWEPPREDGVVAVMVAITMAALLGMAALVVDVGLVRQERRELQNGADAAALAVAIECASNPPCSGRDAIAASYANANAADATSSVTGVVLSGNTVRVDTRTRNRDGTDSLLMRFATAVGAKSTSTVNATATAAWGAPAGGTTIPLTFSFCEWTAMTGNGVTFPTSERTIFFHNPSSPANQNVAPRCSGPAGQDQPGGFGWLDTPAGVCATTISAGGTYPAEPGNSPPNPSNSGCRPEDFLNTDLEIPVFSQSSGNGANAVYQIYGLATFRIQRMRLGGNGSIWTTSPPPTGCTNSQRCIQGYFTKALKPWGGGNVVPCGSAPAPPCLGTYVVKLTE